MKFYEKTTAWIFFIQHCPPSQEMLPALPVHPTAGFEKKYSTELLLNAIIILPGR